MGLICEVKFQAIQVQLHVTDIVDVSTCLWVYQGHLIAPDAWTIPAVEISQVPDAVNTGERHDSGTVGEIGWQTGEWSQDQLYQWHLVYRVSEDRVRRALTVMHQWSCPERIS